MKKILTLAAVFASAVMLNAATSLSVTWSAADLNLSNNAALDGQSFAINSNFSISFANGEADENNYIRFRKVTAMPEPAIAFYSKNVITISATDASITNVEFNILIDDGAGNDSTPGWKFKANDTTLSGDVNTWTGSTDELVLTGGSKSSIISMTIEYTVSDSTEPGEDGDDIKTASLFFTADMIGEGEAVQNITLSNNGTSLVFTTNSASAVLDDTSVNYGTADDYESIPYRYRPGGKSSNGVNSTNKGVFTFPCAGVLYIYAYNTQTDGRQLQIIQDDTEIFNHTYNADDYDTPEGKTTKIYPVLDAKVSAGTAYLLWPDNQVMLSGFVFDPGTPSGVDSVGMGVDATESPAFDLFGRQVGDDYRGIYIKNGKKYVRR